MRIHRSALSRAYAALPNRLLQDRTLSYTARGLLVDLLSRPDGWREDGRRMADSSPQGRAAIRRAIKELIAAGYYWVVTTRLSDGTIRSEIHVFDTPQLVAPSVTRSGPGAAEPGPCGSEEKKDQVEKPTLPLLPVNAAIREAVATLYRVLRPEPRLRLGEREAHDLAPLVARWLELGSTAADLGRALLGSLPAKVIAPVELLRYRLERKMPPAAAQAPTPLRECDRCHDPVPRPGRCRACAAGGGRADPSRTLAIGGGAEHTAAGAARARAAMRATRERVPARFL
ncbi:hypothetical protein [Kitasatospora sp. GAS1066B]|uniref:hypothetical protein n=1 Tax=Kitasatospora sp. GAS1066B TaxID=3156271 RepID=UPI0035182CEF